MKKIISILLAAAMVLAFAACGNNSGNNGGNDAAVTDPLEVLNKVWSALPEDYKFPAAGGDNNNAVEDKPGKFDISDADNLDYMLSFPADSVRAKRFGGWYHADSEPITKYDTSIIKSLEGFSWNP